jgi:hypothetical protein
MCVYNYTCAARSIFDNSCVLWLDNFSNIYKKSKLKVSSHAYNAALWAVEAVHIYRGSIPVCLRFIHNNNELVPGIPPNLFTQSSVDRLKSLFSRRQSDDGFSICNDGNSLWNTFRPYINNTALKPDITSELFPEYFARLVQKRDSLKHITPTRILLHNPGSDIGLANCVGQIMKLSRDSFKQRYIPLKVDTNIYTRILQVILTMLMIISLFIQLCMLWMDCFYLLIFFAL